MSRPEQEMETSLSRSFAELADIALEVAQEAALFAAEGYRRPKQVAHKGEKDLVTEYDTATEELIRERLGARTPEIGIVAEEQGGTASGATWYVDPIDGTTNYAHGHPFWCVSIGLVEGKRFLAGAVVAPKLGLWWRGSSGERSLRNGEPCFVSGTSGIGDSLLATGFPYDRRTSEDNNIASFAALKRQALGIRRCGSAALDLCLVADGTYDGYWERKLQPWDLSAGVCIVQGAGGVVTDLAGEELDAKGGGYLAATNGRIHQMLLAALAGASS